MPNIPIPTTDESIDPGDDPLGAGVFVALLAVGFAVLLLAASGGQWLYNQFASATPDQIGQVEVL